MENKNQSIKNDYKDHKLRWDLLPLAEIEDIVRVYTAGADKYGPNMWQGLPDGYNRYKGAMLRHLMEYEKGNPVDEETGCLHLAQVAWNAIAMLYFSKQSKEDKQNQLLKALDKRIEEKIDNCNKILDEIENEHESDVHTFTEAVKNVTGKTTDSIIENFINDFKMNIFAAYVKKYKRDCIVEISRINNEQISRYPLYNKNVILFRLLVKDAETSNVIHDSEYFGFDSLSSGVSQLINKLED